MPNDTPNPRGPDAVTRQLPAGELPPGWQLLEGQYEIKHVIAAGGFGITYLAKDMLGRDVAVKECFPLGLAQRASQTHTVSATSAGTSEHFETARGQFLREARTLAGLRHPNVVHVQTLFEENGTAYMAMDFIHGRDLQEEIVTAREALSPHRVMELTRDLLGALKYIHAQSVLHRDIKPQNIRIDRFGMPMLIDFGAARAETQARSRMAGTFRVVTDGYSPHEFYVSGADQGAWSDLYALAATLYHVITGAAPVAADERASAIATGQADPYVPVSGRFPDQDGRLLHLIDRALRMAPGERPNDAAAWLAALADAPTTMVAAPVAAEAAPAPRSGGRFWIGAGLSALLAAAVAGGVWQAQPAWLSPGMDDMMAEMGRLESALAEAETALYTARGDLGTTQAALAEAETTLAALEAADGDMAATMAELEAARAARDAAAAEVADLQRSVETLSVTQAALEDARAARDAATQRAADLAEEAETSAERIEVLEAELAAAQNAATGLNADAETATAEIARLEQALTSERTRAAALAGVAAQLTVAEEDLAEAADDIAALEARLATALEAGSVDETMQAEMDRLENALAASEAARTRLLADLEAAGTSDVNASEVDRLRARITALETENAALQAALAEALPPQWVEAATLRAPNGTLAMMPRFSWDHARMAVVDTTGGISIFDRDTGAYQAHLARGIPDEITRVGFSRGGGLLLVTTPEGTQNRLFNVDTARELLRFSPTTVTTAGRAISGDDRWFLYTRAAANGRVDVVVVDLQSADLSERVLETAPGGQMLRVSFSERSNTVLVLTNDQVRTYTPLGEQLREGPTQLGPYLAVAPLADDQGFFVLRPTGEVAVFPGPFAAEAQATFEARDAYTRYRLSGDRLNFIRIGPETWDVLDLDGMRVRGSGQVGAAFEGVQMALSHDGERVFVGISGVLPARELDVASGEQLRAFGAASNASYSFDGSHLVTWDGSDAVAQIWRARGTEAGAEPSIEPAIAPAIEPVVISQAPPPDTGACSALGEVDPSVGITPDFVGRSRLYTATAGGEMNLSECWSVLPEGLLPLVENADRPLFVAPAPVFAANILATSRPIALDVSARSSCAGELIVDFAGTWQVVAPGSNGVLSFADPGDVDQPMRVWLATADAATTCDALIELGLNEP